MHHPESPATDQAHSAGAGSRLGGWLDSGVAMILWTDLERQCRIPVLPLHPGILFEHLLPFDTV